MEKFGELLRTKRLEAGLSARELGERAGLTSVSIYRIEAGRQNDLETISRLFEALGYRVDFVVKDLRDGE